MTRSVILFLFLTMMSPILKGQSVDPAISPNAMPTNVFPEDLRARSVPDQRVRFFITPKRIVWKSETGTKSEDLLLKPVLGLTSTSAMGTGFQMTYGEKPASILLDFGSEIHGGIRLEARGITPATGSVGKTVRVRVRFGESADEAMADMNEKGACNDHSVRDMIVYVPMLGGIEFGESAFRFARLDLVDPGTAITFDFIRAVYIYRDLPRPGSFHSSDEKLNQIWQTAAHTVHLTLQQYMFEGAKRDRLVWYGDFHPQAMSTMYIWGTPKILDDTLGKYARETWPLPKWMNGMSNYSLWWLITVGDYWRYGGNLESLKAQHEYIRGLVAQLKPFVKENGQAGFPNPFLDWPTNANRPALDAGTHAMFAMAFDRVAEIAVVLNDSELEKEAIALAKKVRTFVPDHVNNKQAAALMALAKIENPDKPNVPVVANNGGENFSTFYGYYMLEALASGGKYQEAINIIRQYWGAMIDVGATTFWEDFDLKWLEGSGRIDELTPKGKKSLHGDHGAYCYIGFRHSLCHAWSSGPVAWMSAHLLGVQPVEPGFRTVRIKPFLGDLKWVEGSVPTPYGPITVRHEKKPDGSIGSTVKVPKEVRIVKE